MKARKYISALIICMILSITPAAAATFAPTDTFTHWYTGSGVKSVAMRPVYAVESMVTLCSLGIKEDVGRIIDVECDKYGNSYFLTSKGILVSFDSQGNLIKQYSFADTSGTKIEFPEAEGVCVISPSEFYIADTKKARVLHIRNDILVEEIKLPDSDLIPDDFMFQPTKVAVDSKGYLYVVSKGSYYGALMYDSNREFIGFYGANTVRGNVLTTIGYLWNEITLNDEKRAYIKKTLPYYFSDIFIDGRDFVYTCTGMNEEGNIGQIRMLSPGGISILAGSEGFNFGESDVAVRLNVRLRQNFCSIQADDSGFIYALDQAYGLIYIYDTESNLIAAFGGGKGIGEQKGTFVTPCALALSGDRLLVADSSTYSITVFKRTSYGSLLMKAQNLTLKADYLEAEQLWKEVLKSDGLNRLAMIGMARAAYARNDFDTALNYSRLSQDSEIYSMSLGKIMSRFISKNFVWLFLGTVAVLAGITAFIIISIRRRMVLIKNPRVRIMVTAMYHPFVSFQEIKYKQMGSVALAFVMTVVYYVTSVFAVTNSDFRFTTFDASSYNSLFELVKTAGVIGLWTVANWGVCTLRQGNGRIKEVFVVTAYSTLPLSLYNIISVPLSYLITTPNSAIISSLSTITVVVAAIMLCVGLMTIHDFNFSQFVLTSVVTVPFMILIVFVIFMIGILLSQFFGFFVEVALEAIQWN